MRLFWAGALALLLLGLPGVARADDPRAVVRRALKEMGGEEMLLRRPAIRLRVKATLQADSAKTRATGEKVTQAGGSPVKSILDFDYGGGSTFKTVLVTNGDKSWWGRDGMARPVSEAQRRILAVETHADRVLGLVALLDDKGFTLTALPDGKVEGRDVRGIKVSYKDQPDVALHFDKASGLLAKIGFRTTLLNSDKEVFGELLLKDYRLVSDGKTEVATLEAVGAKTDVKSLLAFLKKQAPDARKTARARALVPKLGGDLFAEREKAEAELISLGVTALPALLAARKGGDLELVRRADRCVAVIRAGHAPPVTAAVVRLLAIRQPPGAAEALLDVLPGADELVARETRAALAHLAESDTAEKSALQAAAKSADADRRTAARAVLGLDGGAYLRQPGRRLYLRRLRWPMRQIEMIDGKVRYDMEMSDAQSFNRFEDREFAQP